MYWQTLVQITSLGGRDRSGLTWLTIDPQAIQIRSAIEFRLRPAWANSLIVRRNSKGMQRVAIYTPRIQERKCLRSGVKASGLSASNR